MKSIKYITILLAAFVMASCSNDDNETVGNPTLNIKTMPTSAQFADSLSYDVEVGDEGGIPLSTLKLQLYYGDVMVSDTTIRTKTYGDYTGRLYVPFLQNIPDGTATLKVISQNIKLAKTEQDISLPLTRPDFPYLTLVLNDSTKYKMLRTEQNQYAVTANFDKKVKGYIVAPAVGGQGNEVKFGWDGSEIMQGNSTPIPFSNVKAGNFTISFNTLTYVGAPFLSLKFGGTEMTMKDDNHYYVDKTFTKGDKISVEGIDLSTFWIDPDFFTLNSDNTLTFNAFSGEYRITADFALNYFRVEAMDGGAFSKLKSDGSGSLWIIGDNIGKPSTATNLVGWNTGKALCMAQVKDKVYQVTVVADKQITAGSINFKFFDTEGWSSTISSGLTTTSDVVFVGNGKNGRDAGNLGIISGKSLVSGATYIFTVDLTAGVNAAVLSVEKK
jgi:hypothetical protein